MNANRITLTALLILALFGGRPLFADRLLDQGMRKMAVEIKKYLDAEGLPKSMIVGDFSGAPRLKASGGVELSRSIAEHLEAAGLRVSDDGELQLLGNFKLTEKRQFPGEAFDSLALEIEATILDGSDDELVTLEFAIFGSVTLQIAGIDVDIPAKATDAEREKEIIDAGPRPQTQLRGTIVRAAPTSLFGLELLVNNANKLSSRTPTLDSKRRAFVKLHKGEEFVVRLWNDADHEVAVDLTVDGVSAFVLAKKKRVRNSLFIVAPHSSYVVPGWFWDLSNTNAFEIGGYAKSVNKQVGGSSAGVGTISARFRASWGGDVPRPVDEPRAGANSKDAAAPGKAVVLGRDLKKNYEQVDRDFGVVRAVVNIRYDK